MDQAVVRRAAVAGICFDYSPSKHYNVHIAGQQATEVLSQEMGTGPPTATPQATVVPATDDRESEEEEEGGPWEMAIQETGPHYPEELAQ